MSTEAAAIVMAPRLDSYPPLRVVREPEMSVHRVEPCACGGSVVQLAGEAVPDVVARHNATLEHRAWRAG